MAIVIILLRTWATDAGKQNSAVAIALRIFPGNDGEILRSCYPDIIPGYYMNKQHWNSLLLDGHVPEPVLIDCIQLPYQTVFMKLTKKKQREIMESSPTARLHFI